MNDSEFVFDAFANKVVNNINVFSLLVVSVIFGKVDSTSVVNEDGGR
jgi:hypothetical protein